MNSRRKQGRPQAGCRLVPLDRHQPGTLDPHPPSAIPGEAVWSKCPIHLVEEARERWPLMNEKDVIGAVWSPDDGRVSPSDLCAALVKGKIQGARIFEETPVTGILTENQKFEG